MKKIICFILTILLLSGSAFASDSEFVFETDDGEVDAAIFEETAVTDGGIEVTAPSAILMEKESGAVIFEKDADKQMQPASVTKVMTRPPPR